MMRQSPGRVQDNFQSEMFTMLCNVLCDDEVLCNVIVGRCHSVYCFLCDDVKVCTTIDLQPRVYCSSVYCFLCDNIKVCTTIDLQPSVYCSSVYCFLCDNVKVCTTIDCQQKIVFNVG